MKAVPKKKRKSWNLVPADVVYLPFADSAVKDCIDIQYLMDCYINRKRIAVVDGKEVFIESIIEHRDLDISCDIIYFCLTNGQKLKRLVYDSDRIHQEKELPPLLTLDSEDGS